jgi:hypothetical protein
MIKTVCWQLLDLFIEKVSGRMRASNANLLKASPCTKSHLAFRPITQAAIDVHLMVKPVDRIIPAFAKADANIRAIWQGVTLIAFGVLVIGLIDNFLRPILAG